MREGGDGLGCRQIIKGGGLLKGEAVMNRAPPSVDMSIQRPLFEDNASQVDRKLHFSVSLAS